MVPPNSSDLSYEQLLKELNNYAAELKSQRNQHEKRLAQKLGSPGLARHQRFMDSKFELYTTLVNSLRDPNGEQSIQKHNTGIEALLNDAQKLNKLQKLVQDKAAVTSDEQKNQVFSQIEAMGKSAVSVASFLEVQRLFQTIADDFARFDSDERNFAHSTSEDFSDSLGEESSELTLGSPSSTSSYSDDVDDLDWGSEDEEEPQTRPATTRFSGKENATPSADKNGGIKSQTEQTDLKKPKR